MSFLSCEEMLAAAPQPEYFPFGGILRSDLAESRLTEAHSREMMHHLWQVMQATSRDYDPAQRSRSGLSGGDAAKVEQPIKRKEPWRRLPRRSDGRSSQDRRVQRLHEAHRRCPHGGQLRRPACCSAAAGPSGEAGRRVHLRRPLCRRRVRSGHRGPRHSRGRGGRLSGRGGRCQRDGSRRSATSRAARRSSAPLPPQWLWATCWASSAIPWPASWKFPASSECRWRSECRLLCEYGPCRSGLRHPL